MPGREERSTPMMNIPIQKGRQQGRDHDPGRGRHLLLLAAQKKRRLFTVGASMLISVATFSNCVRLITCRFLGVADVRDVCPCFRIHRDHRQSVRLLRLG